MAAMMNNIDDQKLSPVSHPPIRLVAQDSKMADCPAARFAPRVESQHLAHGRHSCLADPTEFCSEKLATRVLDTTSNSS